MTQLRQKMLEELQCRNYSHRTAKTYVRIVREFATYFHQPPDKLGPGQIRQYQAHLFQSKKLAPATVSQYVSALRFLFIKTLHRHFLAAYIPFPSPQAIADRAQPGGDGSTHRLGPQSLSPHSDEQIANRACKTHSSPASAAPAASSKSSYRKCPGGTQSGPRGYMAPAHLR